MRRFNSYGPSDSRAHFCVERRELVENCIEQLVGRAEESGGHYFTMWAPRQTGKTWVMRRAVEEIRKRYADRFIVGDFVTQGLLGRTGGPANSKSFFEDTPGLFREAFGMDIATPTSWNEWRALFAKKGGVFDKPIVLMIDEFDSLPPKLMDHLVGNFRKMYLKRDAYQLHGLALVGVRAVLGIDSPRGSPFNVQRSLQIPNLTRDEVIELFRQYQDESGQRVEPDVPNALFDATRGQPGLVGWFGELLTEKYNPGKDKPIASEDWRRVYSHAVHVEWNNNLLNSSKKARGPHRAEVMKLFTDPNVPFSMDLDWCSYLYMNGIIDKEELPSTKTDRHPFVCRFSSPFVQRRLYTSLTMDMFGDKSPLLAIEIGDALDDVFTPQGIDVSTLLERYRGYLKRLKSKGIDPWIGEPRRQDLHYTEAVGHFHLYAWLQNAIGRQCTISPEFPTGNGKVDLVLRFEGQTYVIEVKSFIDMYELRASRIQAAAYAPKLGLSASNLVVFAPTDDDAALRKLADDSVVQGVRVTTIPFGWV